MGEIVISSYSSFSKSADNAEKPFRAAVLAKAFPATELQGVRKSKSVRLPKF